jgi:hypothetical protein
VPKDYSWIYLSSAQLCRPHRHVIIRMDLPLRESSSVRTSVTFSPHLSQTGDEGEAGRALAIASGST